MSELELTVSFTAITCKCGGTYAIAKNYCDDKRINGGGWRCPYCEVSWGFWESENDRLTKQLAREKARHDQTRAEVDHQRQLKEAAERRAIGQRAAKTRIKNRIAHGVCPCCNRSFENLARHMKGQHPGYSSTEEK